MGCAVRIRIILIGHWLKKEKVLYGSFLCLWCFSLNLSFVWLYQDPSNEVILVFGDWSSQACWPIQAVSVSLFKENDIPGLGVILGSNLLLPVCTDLVLVVFLIAVEHVGERFNPPPAVGSIGN